MRKRRIYIYAHTSIFFSWVAFYVNVKTSLLLWQLLTKQVLDALLKTSDFEKK